LLTHTNINIATA